MELISILKATVAKKLGSFFGYVLSEFGEEVMQLIDNNILEYQMEEYHRNSLTKTILHRAQPKKLKEFYQPLFIRQCDKRSRAKNNEERIPTNSIGDLFAQNPFITLTGNAGSGKSTIVKYLFLNAIDTDYRIPIKIELRYLNDFDGTLTDYVIEKIFKFNHIASHGRIIERLMNSGNFVFFLDGYDEINSHKKQKITKEIDDLVKIYGKNNYLLTTRPYTHVDLLPLFHNYEVCELSDEEINEFIKKQIPVEETELQNKIIEAVNSRENNSYKTFVSNPLLLSMFILTFQSYSSIPQKRSEFYSQVFDALFSVHDSMTKLAFVREKQSGLAKEQFIEVLKLFSFISYFDEKFIFSQLYLAEKFQLIKEKKNSLKFDNTLLLEDLQIAIGILNQEGTDFTFPHRSLQEYFAATYIASLSDENKKNVYSKIKNQFSQKSGQSSISRDNFYLLLSELDEKGTIEYILIPFFDEFAKGINLDETAPEKIINNFLLLNSIFVSFHQILKSQETTERNHHFVKKFHAYINMFESDNTITVSNSDERKLQAKTISFARRKLALEDIAIFLKEFMPTLIAKSNELKEYLLKENKSDADIVSLI